MIVVASLLMFTPVGMITLGRPGRGCYRDGEFLRYNPTSLNKFIIGFQSAFWKRILEPFEAFFILFWGGFPFL